MWNLASAPCEVTIIGNVTGDATRLARALQTMLGVGGSVRQAEKGAWCVEVQGVREPRSPKRYEFH